MFEPIGYNLFQFSEFVVIGFFLGVIYEPLRILRLFKRQGVFLVGIQDFLFLIFAAIITFAYSMELGSGQLRLFFIIGEILGAGIYFLTIGRIISLFSSQIVRFIKFCLSVIKKYLMAPLLYFFHKHLNILLKLIHTIYNHFKNIIRKLLNSLKKHRQMVYNKRQPGIIKEKGELRNVVKAKITKKA